MTADVEKRLGITAKLAEVRKANPDANVCMVRFLPGGSTPYRLTDATAQPVTKSAVPATAQTDELVAPVTKAAHEHNVDVVKTRRAAFDAYVTKVAGERNVTVQKAAADLAHARDPEYLSLWKRASDALHSPLRAHAEASKATYTAFETERSVTAHAADIRRANAEAQKVARMTASEAELHKRAHARSVEKRIDYGAAMAELMEDPSGEALKLYRKIAFEKHGR